jgi:hypothetical protein
LGRTGSHAAARRRRVAIRWRGSAWGRSVRAGAPRDQSAAGESSAGSRHGASGPGRQGCQRGRCVGGRDESDQSRKWRTENGVLKSRTGGRGRRQRASGERGGVNRETFQIREKTKAGETGGALGSTIVSGALLL